MLAFPESALTGRFASVAESLGPKGPLATFLKDFGPALLKKYKPSGILVFSAHWETANERLGMSSFSSQCSLSLVDPT
jgi:aromatic ring-opening dioxygenase catalytic subunit (LigB family)